MAGEASYMAAGRAERGRTRSSVGRRRRYWMRIGARYALAVGLIGVALAVRFALAPQLQDRIPLATVFIGVVLAAFLAGPGATATAALLGYLAADWLFIEPLHSIGPRSTADVVRLIVYFVVSGAVIVGSTRISRARRRAELNLAKLEREVAERKRVEEALRESERALRLARHAAQIGAWSWNFSTGAHDWSARYRALLGLRANSPTGYDVFLRALHPGDRDRIDRAVKDAIENRTPYQVEMRVPLPDGSVRWVASRGEAYYDGAGRPLRMAGMALDITSQKEAEEGLRRSEEALREADRRKDEFLGVLSHELRNPLAPIRNSVQILMRTDPAGEQAVRARDIIARQVEHLTRLVDDLLDVKRITTGKLRLHRTEMDVVQQVREAVEDLRPLFTSRLRSLEVNVSPEPVWIRGDRTRVSQLVSNLLHNAAKFTDPGGHVSVTVASEGGMAVVRVRDDGVGVPPGMLDRMFEPFVQSDNTLHRTEAGLGLGLSLVRSIAQLHGGAVRARSEGVGKGTEFIVTFPAIEPGTAVASDVTLLPRRDAKRRVLIIEDNADAAESLRDVVEVLGGHEVRVAADGETGVAEAREHGPDVILCDIGLPVVDGFEVARRIRAAGIAPGARLVALSGYASAGDIARAIRAGFDYHVGKPPDVDRLLTLVAEAPGGGQEPSVPEDIATGHHELDAQHASMLAEARRLRGAGEGEGAAREALRLLQQHLAAHLAYAEALMEDLGYPDLHVDKRRHEDFLDRIRTLRGRVEREGATPSGVTGVADVVEAWIAEHAVSEERRLAGFIRGRASERQDGSPRTAELAPVRPV